MYHTIVIVINVYFFLYIIYVKNYFILKYMNNKYRLLDYIDPLKTLKINYFSVDQKKNINIKKTNTIFFYQKKKPTL